MRIGHGHAMMLGLTRRWRVIVSTRPLYNRSPNLLMTMLYAFLHRQRFDETSVQQHALGMCRVV